MRIDQDKLVGWLCIMRHNLDDTGAGEFFIPSEIREQLSEAGWVEVGDADDEGRRDLQVTDSGTLVSDLAAPEWGIDPVPIEG